MRSLKRYIETRNHWNGIFGKGSITFPLSQQNIQELAESLDSELSPENLHCDGEISHSEAMAKGNRLMNIVYDLEDYCNKNGKTMPTIYEAW